MIITINGQKKKFAAEIDIASVLKEEGYDGKLLAVARNGEFVPRVAYANTNLEEGDELEILAPMQGG